MGFPTLSRSPFLDAISQAIVMAMEKHAHGRDNNKRKARPPSRFASSSSSTHPSHTFEKGKNTLLHNICKSVQPPIFSHGANTKLEAFLLFLGTVETCLKEIFQTRIK